MYVIKNYIYFLTKNTRPTSFTTIGSTIQKLFSTTTRNKQCSAISLLIKIQLEKIIFIYMINYIEIHRHPYICRASPNGKIL